MAFQIQDYLEAPFEEEKQNDYLLRLLGQVRHSYFFSSQEIVGIFNQHLQRGKDHSWLIKFSKQRELEHFIWEQCQDYSSQPPNVEKECQQLVFQWLVYLHHLFQCQIILHTQTNPYNDFVHHHPLLCKNLPYLNVNSDS